MVPTLHIPKNALRENDFMNAYIKDDDRDIQYENCINLVFKPKNIPKFRQFLNNEYERTSSLIDEYDYENGIVVLVYKLDENFKEDFKIIKTGKYSKTSDKFQSQFPKKVSVTRNGLLSEEVSLQSRIFEKTEDLLIFWEEKLAVTFDPDQEVWEGFEENLEILNKEKLKEYV
jgi:hypothetical protein